MRNAICIPILFLLVGNTAALGEGAKATDCEAPRTFYVVSHGWHTGLVVHGRDLMERVPQLGKDLGKTKYLEVGWGDRRFYRTREVNYGLALRAVLFPTSSVLHVVAVSVSPRQYFSGSVVVEISVPQTGYGKLLDILAGSFSRTASNHLMKLGRGLYGKSQFYRAEGRFHAFNNCNTWVAKAIGATGFPLSTKTITERGLMSQLRPNAIVETKCYSVR